MANSLEVQQNRVGLVATACCVRPGVFALGSVESRAAARALAQTKSRDEDLSPELAQASVGAALLAAASHTHTGQPLARSRR